MRDEEHAVCMVALKGLRLVAEANQPRGTHWTVLRKRRAIQRSMAYYALASTGRSVPPLPLTVTITRIGPRQMDDDNLAGACKSVRDGIADWLSHAPGKGQDRRPGLTWRYAQRRGGVREYGVEIHIRTGGP